MTWPQAVDGGVGLFSTGNSSWPRYKLTFSKFSLLFKDVSSVTSFRSPVPVVRRPRFNEEFAENKCGSPEVVTADSHGDMVGIWGINGINHYHIMAVKDDWDVILLGYMSYM